MDNIIEWFENFVWIFLIVAAVIFIIYQSGLIDSMAEIVVNTVFHEYVINI